MSASVLATQRQCARSPFTVQIMIFRPRLRACASSAGVAIRWCRAAHEAPAAKTPSSLEVPGRNARRLANLAVCAVSPPRVRPTLAGPGSACATAVSRVVKMTSPGASTCRTRAAAAVAQPASFRSTCAPGPAGQQPEQVGDPRYLVARLEAQLPVGELRHRPPGPGRVEGHEHQVEGLPDIELEVVGAEVQRAPVGLVGPRGRPL